MSYILDALKKSEQERGVGAMLTPTNNSGTLAAPLRRRLWPLAVGLALALIILLVLVRFWSHPDAPATPTGIEVSASVVKAAPVVSKKSNVPVQTLAARSSVRDLAEQTRLGSSKRKPIQTQAEPVPIATAAPTITDTVDEYVDPDDIPFLRQMPDAFRKGIPDMVVNVHLYSTNEAENVVYIDDRQYRRGERIKGGIRLEAIVHDGVVLSHGATQFKLPRPN